MSEIPIWKTPLAEGCFMVGARNPSSLLQCNTYLRSFHGDAGNLVHWCVDPGSQLDYTNVRQHLLDHIGALQALRMFSINHQDPDVVGNLTYLVQENPRVAGLVSEDVWRLVRHLNANPRQLFFANQARKNLVTLPTGQKIQVVPTPFCHFRGAMAFYDPESQILFSGDLCGGFNQVGRVHLYGEETDWPGIAQFHRIYMPSNAAVAHAIRQIRNLQPRVKVIAPQHGFVLQGDFMHYVLDRLELLPVGMDLLSAELDERYFQAYGQVLAEVIQEAATDMGRMEVMSRLKALPEDHDLRRCIEIRADDVALVRHGIQALPLLIEVLTRGQLPHFRAALKSRVIQACTHLGAPLPDLGVGAEEVGEAADIAMLE